MSSIVIPAGVGWTSLLTAYVRAQETRSAAPLFEDPLAVRFISAVAGGGVGPSGGLPRLGPAADDGSSKLWADFRFYFTERTPFYDRNILQAVEAGCQQVVMLGAGLDSRAFRLGLGEDITFFELDQSAVLDFKQSVLDREDVEPTCRRVPLAVDLLGEDWPTALTRAGFSPSVPTVWVAEGLLMYLSAADSDLLTVRFSSLSAPGSRFAGENWTRKWVAGDLVQDTWDEGDRAAWSTVSGMFLYGPIDQDPSAWLSGHGWTAQEVTTVSDMARQGGRPVPPDLGVGSPQVWLIAAGR